MQSIYQCRVYFRVYINVEYISEYISMFRVYINVEYISLLAACIYWSY